MAEGRFSLTHITHERRDWAGCRSRLRREGSVVGQGRARKGRASTVLSGTVGAYLHVPYPTHMPPAILPWRALCRCCAAAVSLCQACLCLCLCLSATNTPRFLWPDPPDPGLVHGTPPLPSKPPITAASTIGPFAFKLLRSVIAQLPSHYA